MELSLTTFQKAMLRVTDGRRDGAAFAFSRNARPRASGEALSCSLFAEGSATAARPRGVALRGHFFGFAFFTADFLAPFFALLLPLPRSALAAR